MKKILIFLSLFFSVQITAQKILPFYWLVGKWETVDKKGSTYELWKQQNDSTLYGLSYLKTTKGDSIPLEEVELRLRNGSFYYVPRAFNQNDGKPVEFKMTAATTDSFVFENPLHDFPKKIIYQFVRGKNQILASIEGDGKRKEWLYSKKSVSNTFVMPEKDTVYTMKEYYVCFLKRGGNRTHSTAEAAKIQEAHLAHINEMYNLGLISLVGPYGGDGDIRGMTVFNTPNLEEAIWWANQDPAVKAGRLVIECHSWWTSSGGKLK